MRYLKYIILIFSIFFFNIYNVFASCTSEEINELKKQADNIKITYKHLDKIATDDGDYIYDAFDVVINNVPDDFYITYLGGSKRIDFENTSSKVTLYSGDWIFNVYSKKCDIKIDEIKFKLPKFNIYSLDPLCEGIDGNDFSLCGKYYEYDIDYDSFKKRVNHYRITHNITNDDDNTVVEEKVNIFDMLVFYFMKYRMYVLISLVILLFLLIIIMVIQRKKRRGVLQ